MAAWLREMRSCRSGGPARLGLVTSETKVVLLWCGFIHTIIRACETSYRLRRQGRYGMPVHFLMARSGVSRAPTLPGTASQSGSQIAPAQRQRGPAALAISLRYEPRKPCRRPRSGALHVAYGPHNGQRMVHVLARTLASACRRIGCDGGLGRDPPSLICAPAEHTYVAFLPRFRFQEKGAIIPSYPLPRDTCFDRSSAFCNPSLANSSQPPSCRLRPRSRSSSLAPGISCWKSFYKTGIIPTSHCVSR